MPLLPIRTLTIDALQVQVYADADGLALAAAQRVIAQLQHTLQHQAMATVIFATGRSQLGVLHHLRQDTSVDWSRVVGFHLDEFLGLDRQHPASFGYYLRHHIAQWLPFQAFHYLEGDALEPMAECDRYTQLLQQQPIDLCLLGIGNNGHLAFNDPAVADFNDPRWVKLVRLDTMNRQQQLTSAHFTQLRDVPTHAITLSLSAIMRARHSLCCVFGQGKANIVNTLLKSSPATTCPASILRMAKPTAATLFTDKAALSTYGVDDVN